MNLEYVKNRINELAFDYIIDIYADRQKDFFFVEIGAHDGISGDPIHAYIIKYKWKGILVEPVKYLFDKLVTNYKGQENLIFENVAIGNKNEIRDLYRLKQTGDIMPAWYEGLGSFYPDVVLKHKAFIPNIEDYLITERVKCVTLKDLLQKYNITDIDLLQIDVEGYEYEIIKSIDFNAIRPKIIHYENKHLNINDNKGCDALLKTKGYTVFDSHTVNDLEETVAFLNSFEISVRLCMRILFHISGKILYRLTLQGHRA